MAVYLILEASFYLLSTILATFAQGDIPYMIQILAYVTICEFLKHFLFLKLDTKPDSLALKLKQPEKERKIVPIKDSNNFTRRVEKGSKKNKSPVSVNSLMMHEMSQALGLDTELNPSKYPDPFLANLQKKRLEKKSKFFNLQ
ncbi:hypothetical protein TNCT_155121 [Trichonephila clavata]|uniref:Uncharacterized protein n=1 Tax=Trichonephila clavata TaxID=2740835 RepID=A0A8X6M3N1_TRICU|nr:hypothetical protein TNCT_155121 [Trichonephila clavata]